MSVKLSEELIVEKIETFVGAVVEYRDYLLNQTEISSSDREAIVWGLGDYVESTMVKRALTSFLPRGFDVYGPKRTTVILPSTGLTTPVESLLNPYVLSEELQVKISESDPYAKKFVELLDGPVYFTERREIFKKNSDVMIAYGSDATVETLEQTYKERSVGKFIGYGSKFSVAVYDEFPVDLVGDTIRDITTFGGLGCLNTHVIFYKETEENDQSSQALVSRLDEMNETSTQEFLWESSRVAGVVRRGDHAVEISPEFDGSWDVLPRGGGTVVLAPYAKSVREYDGWFDTYHGKLSSAAVTSESLKELMITRYGFSRVCQPGRAQEPSIFWVHDGVVEVVEMCNFVAEEW